jgi:hypothetical protein
VFGTWRERGESDLLAGAGGYLAGVLPSQEWSRGYVVGTDRRVAILTGLDIARGGRLKAKCTAYAAPWSRIRAFAVDDEQDQLALLIGEREPHEPYAVVVNGAPDYGGWRELCEKHGLPRE